MKLHAFRYVGVDRFLGEKLVDFAVPAFQFKYFGLGFFEIIFPLSLLCLFFLLLLPVQLSGRFRFRLRSGSGSPRSRRRQNIMLFQIIIVIADIID